MFGLEIKHKFRDKNNLNIRPKHIEKMNNARIGRFLERVSLIAFGLVVTHTISDFGTHSFYP